MTYQLPDDQWQKRKVEICTQLEVPLDPAIRLKARQTELEERMARLDGLLAERGSVRVEDGRLVLSPLEAEAKPERIRRLEALIAQRMPLVDLTDLFIEMDGLTGFSNHFEHAGGSEPRSQDLHLHLYASVLAQACNFNTTRMAQVADLSYRRLAWCANWYVREETLKEATAKVVNYHYRLPLSRVWGNGTFSSSDGQRFPVTVQNRQAAALPRYFGLGKGITIITWTSDQRSQYGTKPISPGTRESLYVLDEIVDNKTDLPIAAHTTDTNGMTEIQFALFDLFNLQFAPRIRDIADQRLYRMDSAKTFTTLDPLITGTIRQRLIVEHWDDLLRLAASIKTGWVTASLLIGKLQAYPRQNALTRALQEYGRLIKTIFILRYLESEEYRHRIEAQLNKGEEIHALRQFLFFASEGKLRKRQNEAQINQASCLNLVTNTVITWNTIYMAAIVQQLRQEGHEIADDDLAHISPVRYEHLNVYGRYHFNIEQELQRKGQRPLRSLDAET